MSVFQALILGIVQGTTEFFPVSSSAHLRLFKHLLGIPDGEQLLYFDLLCHVGTLLALSIYLRKDIWRVLTQWRQILLFALALLPLIPGYFLLKPLRIALSAPPFLGYFLILTSLFLFIATKRSSSSIPRGIEKLGIEPGGSPDFSAGARGIAKGKTRSEDEKYGAKPTQHQNQFFNHDRYNQKWTNVLWIGVMQTMALIPGISRSGATIATARLCGWQWIEAARFSFLLAVPTIVGGEFLETLRLVKGSSEALGAVSWFSYAVGFAASFGVGMFAVRVVFWIYEKGKVRPFAWYCLGTGLLALAIFHG